MTGNTIANHDIMPGDTIVLNPTIENRGTEGNPVYVFMQTEMDSDFQIPDEDFDDRWQKLSDNTYYYCDTGNTSKLAALDSGDYTTPLTSIKLSEEVDDFDADYIFKVTAYAIQTKNVKAASPSNAWNLAKDATPVEYMLILPSHQQIQMTLNPLIRKRINMYKVLYIEPLKAPRVIETYLSLDSIHTLVQGEVFQAVFPWEDDCALLCSDTGKLDLLTPNRIIGNDIIAGPFLIVGLGEEDFCELSEALIDKYSEIFATPEIFIPEPDGIAVIKIMEEPQ